ncbi:MmyB family transcriptional regulator [Streptomyces sp. NBC_01450]|uniref:MmyB family transcriptional regulator n=1 Tax=Streptomyces sp. NBC_01450 TaxID=2903871 RepID=UPI003FCCE921
MLGRRLTHAAEGTGDDRDTAGEGTGGGSDAHPRPRRAARRRAHPPGARPAPRRGRPPGRSQQRVTDGDQVAAETVAILRLEAGRHPHDRRLADLVAELTLKSPEFSTWWNDHRVLSRGRTRRGPGVLGDVGRSASGRAAALLL